METVGSIILIVSGIWSIILSIAPDLIGPVARLMDKPNLVNSLRRWSALEKTFFSLLGSIALMLGLAGLLGLIPEGAQHLDISASPSPPPTITSYPD